MASKVRVYGKAQNRTALGIVNAYLVMYPHATLDDLRKAFPNELSAYDEFFLDEKGMQELIDEEMSKGNKFFGTGQGYFQKDDEIITLADGTKVYMVSMWQEKQFKPLVNLALRDYDIEVAEFEKTMKGEKGGFRLEYLNGWTPPTPSKKKIPAWVWAALAGAVALIAIGAFLLGGSGKKTETVEVEKIVEVHDTVYVQQLAEIETNFNAAQFEQGKYELNDDAKFVLHDLAKLMEKNPELKLKIEGHTSAEGDAAANKTLSENRAKATVDFLVSQGVAQERLQYEGCGSEKLKNTENPNAEENRRTEFVVIK